MTVKKGVRTMGLLNDIYDAADQAMNARQEKKRHENAKKALAKQKAKQAAEKRKNGGLFL